MTDTPRFGADPQAFFEAVYAATPPWDIGDVQPDLAALLQAHPPEGPALDLGCGPGDNAIHLARLNVAWAGCDHCEWRFDAEGLAERTVVETGRIRSHRIDGIRRTEFGIRGQYINDLDRQTAADLTRVAKQYLLLDRMAVVVVGDRASIEAPIRAANLGPVTVVPVADVMK